MIEILLSTYNGAAFLGPQVESILTQTHGDFRLIVRDDGSRDDTLSLIERYAAADPRISVLRDARGNLGARRSFMALLESSTSEFFMLCDQDDVWLPGKVAASMARLGEMQTRYGDRVPLLVFTDLTVVDSKLEVVASSMWNYQRLDPRISANWRDLLAQNVVTGSTLIANAAARRASLPFVLTEMMHDHWIAVNTARSGHLDYLREPTVLYRQHGNNVEGARRVRGRYLLGNGANLLRKIAVYQRAASYYGAVSAAGLFLRKVALNARRLFPLASGTAETARSR